ncbi:hypothetical protein KABACHOK_00860 [Brevundimonas phage vB_BpoS-Kabachok]|uniref:Uncharacterized protein n=1 Tax=Brevundimonas phage vB_BpoS-Kabachok TaxID=2948600 RepID=A0A9E7MPU6_9CAUD|nr:hypothetical protein KABACHOK_00860 [Brevundimonas phage vB_BpoS-Kabachok]
MATLEGRLGINIEVDLALASVMIRRGACEMDGSVEVNFVGEVGRAAAFSPLFTVDGDPNWFNAIGWATDRAGPITHAFGAIDDGVPLCTAYEFDTGPVVYAEGGGGPVPDPGDLTLLFDNRLI